MIVNRGWLPRKLLDQHIASSNKEEDGEISIVGVLRHGEEVRVCFFLVWLVWLAIHAVFVGVFQKGKFTPDNDLKNRQFFFLQHEELASAMGVDGAHLPVIIDALGEFTAVNAFAFVSLSLVMTLSCTHMDA